MKIPSEKKKRRGKNQRSRQNRERQNLVQCLRKVGKVSYPDVSDTTFHLIVMPRQRAVNQPNYQLVTLMKIPSEKEARRKNQRRKSRGVKNLMRCLGRKNRT